MGQGAGRGAPQLRSSAGPQHDTVDLQGGAEPAQKRHLPEWQGQFKTTICCTVGVVSTY